MQAGTLLFVGVALTEPAQIAGAATQLVTNCNDARPRIAATGSTSCHIGLLRWLQRIGGEW